MSTVQCTNLALCVGSSHRVALCSRSSCGLLLRVSLTPHARSSCGPTPYASVINSASVLLAPTFWIVGEPLGQITWVDRPDPTYTLQSEHHCYKQCDNIGILLILIPRCVCLPTFWTNHCSTRLHKSNLILFIKSLLPQKKKRGGGGKQAPASFYCQLRS